MKQHFFAVFGLSLMFLNNGCKQSDFEASSGTSTVSPAAVPDYKTLFSEQDINLVYSSPKDVDANSRPTSKSPIVKSFVPTSAPATFAGRFTGEYTHGSETRAFLNLGKPQDSAAQKRLIKNLESISAWKEMKHSDGNPVFVDTYTLDEKTNQKTADIADGIAPASPGEKHLLRMMLKKSFLTLSIDGMSTLSNNNGLVTMRFHNTKDVTAPIIGSVIRPDSFRMDVYAFPYKNGWLVYGATAVKIEKIESMYKPEMISNIMAAMFNWLSKSTAQ